jgi:hypothetical protein
MTANLLANTGANICLGNNESLFVDVHDIDPAPVGIETTPKDAMQVTYCHCMGYLPMQWEDGSINMQPWYIHPDVVGCMLSPESIMSSTPNITSWYQEGFRDSLNPGTLCFRNSDNFPVLHSTLQKCNGLYFGHTNVLSIDHNPIRVHCVNGALVFRASSGTGSCENTPHAQIIPPDASPTLIKDDDSSSGSLLSVMSDNLTGVNNGMDSHAHMDQPSRTSDISPTGRSTRCTVLNLCLSLKSMKRILTNYGTVYLSNGYESHGVSLELLVKRDGGKLPSFLASVSVQVIVW